MNDRNSILRISANQSSIWFDRRKLIHGILLSIISLIVIRSTEVSIAYAQQRSSSDDNRLLALNSLTDQLHVGTEFFLNRTGTKESIEKHFRLMHDNGLTLVRIFIIWDDIERTPGTWNFEKYD